MASIPSGPLECPREDCLSNCGEATPRVIHHASHRTKTGVRKRRRCMVCGVTFSSLTGTAYAGLRRRKADVDRVLQMHSEGMTKAAIARVVRVSPGTVARWIERAAQHARSFHDARTQIEEAVEVQLDELSCGGVGDAKGAWAFSGIEVSSRLWAGLLVAKRTLRATKQFVREVKYTIGSITEWTLFTSDCFKYYKPAMNAVFEDDPAVYLQIKNRYRGGKIVRSTWTRAMGSELAHDDALARNSDSLKPNTAFIERLNLTKRMCCSLLRRRNPSPARKIESLQSALELVRLIYNYVRPHFALRTRRGHETPAMAAGITTRPLRLREIMSWSVPGSEKRRLALRTLFAHA